jgi:hypothetical protein
MHGEPLLPVLKFVFFGKIFSVFSRLCLIYSFVRFLFSLSATYLWCVIAPHLPRTKQGSPILHSLFYTRIVACRLPTSNVGNFISAEIVRRLTFVVLYVMIFISYKAGFSLINIHPNGWIFFCQLSILKICYI